MIPFLECGPFYLSWSTQEAGTLKMSHFHVPPQSVHTCQCTHVSSHVALTAQTDKGSQAGACAKQGPGGSTGQSSLDKKKVLLKPGPQSCCSWESEPPNPWKSHPSQAVNTSQVPL